MKKVLPQYIEIFQASKDVILDDWLSSLLVQEILEKHNVDLLLFKNIYASGVFDHFMNLLDDKSLLTQSCPVMLELIEYLNDYNIYVDELFSICAYFKKVMLNFTYDSDFNSKEIFTELSYLFDENFTGLLKKYTQTIYLAHKEVEKASQAREYFLSNMSHEIRTPLNAIIGFVKILKDEKNSKAHQKYLEIIENSSESLMHIINDILDFSKLSSGEFNIEERAFNIHEELPYTLELFVANVSDKHQTLQSFIDPKIPQEIIVDGFRIKQILSNFLSNAIKFTPKYGDIKVRVKFHNERLQLSVEDSGIGISEENQKNIFNAFMQVNNQEHIYDGTGLGLAICSQLAEHMGGSVSVDATVGKGSTFTLDIPIKRDMHKQKELIYDVTFFQKLTIGLFKSSDLVEHKVAFLRDYWRTFGLNIIDVEELDEDAYDLLFFVDSEVSKREKELLTKERTPLIALLNYLDDSYDTYSHITPIYFPIYCSKLYEAFLQALHLSSKTDTNIVVPKATKKFHAHILVAEDNDANQELIKVVLEKLGISYYIASDGVEAFQTFKITPFDLVLMDEQMPHQNGSETTEKILEYEIENKLKHTPIVALTANAQKGVKENSLALGYDAFLTKPLNVKELTELFSLYLQGSEELLAQKSLENKTKIYGIDSLKLKKDFDLEESELLALVETFIRKSKQLITQFLSAVKENNYKSIEKLAHSLKGSSANFRLTKIEKLSSYIEKSARDKKSIDYSQYLQEIEEVLATIYIEQ